MVIILEGFRSRRHAVRPQPRKRKAGALRVARRCDQTLVLLSIGAFDTALSVRLLLLLPFRETV